MMQMWINIFFISDFQVIVMDIESHCVPPNKYFLSHFLGFFEKEKI